ncbi:MAG TPA: glycosyltransferase [Acetobacteraceae bacterium]|nr:glycosyltransferase [Acetobacteraceae bacterium]
MTHLRSPPRVLIVSPIASHPADQGNSARIQAMGRELMARGVVCEFLHYATEGCTPAQEAAMSAFWRGGFHPVPPQPPSRMGMPGAWALDDWCPAFLADQVAHLHRRGRHDALLVHYVWMSRVLEGVEGGALRVLDTHDLFGDRHMAAREQGLDPSWFFTTREEEARGLARADLVLAIQDAEAAILRERSAAPVLTLGHMPPLRFLAADDRTATAPPPPRRSVFGYFGSANPWNVASVRALDAALADAPDLPWLLAGQITRRDLRLRSHPVLLGPVPDAEDFYHAVECVLNPMAGGTGLKIKTVEALAAGLPVLGTRDAFAGLPANHPGHGAADIIGLVALMREYRQSEAFRTELRRASRLLALRCAAAVARQADELAALLAAARAA